MKHFECELESDALSAALQSRWPAQVDPGLRAHIERCPVCSDVIAIATAIDDTREAMRAVAVLPDAGRVWWLAQLRARREAAEAAGHPITAAQMIAFACAVGLLGAFFGATSSWFQALVRWTGSSLACVDLKALLHSTLTILAAHSALASAAAVVLLLLPTAVYLALGKE
jgi:hypothetical protein